MNKTLTTIPEISSNFIGLTIFEKNTLLKVVRMNLPWRNIQ